MTFKMEWEKTTIPETLTPELVHSMVDQAYPGSFCKAYEILSGGCANINVKVFLQQEQSPRLLRLYLRDRQGAFREKKLGLLLEKTLPVPLIEYVGECGGYDFAMASFLEGISLRDVLLGESSYDLEEIMRSVGHVLAQISSHTFSCSGFFDSELRMKKEDVIPDFSAHGRYYLTNKSLAEYLGGEMVAKAREILEKYGSFFPKDCAKNLVHGDFGPENILVNLTRGHWKISGILDWEFSFSGSSLWDVANMLRYAYKMPALFETAFLEGLSQGGLTLPMNWSISVRLLNLVAVLDCLESRNFQTHPQTWADGKQVIQEILRSFKDQK